MALSRHPVFLDVFEKWRLQFNGPERNFADHHSVRYIDTLAMRTISRSCTDPKRRIQNSWKNQTYWIHINYQKQTSKNPPLQPFCTHNYSPFPEKNSLDSRMTIIFFPRDSKYFPRRILSVQIVSKYVFIVPKKTQNLLLPKTISSYRT